VRHEEQAELMISLAHRAVAWKWGGHGLYLLRAMRFAFLAEWHRALGTTYEVTEGGRHMHAIISGITS
jgi:hypothetical protein